MHSMYETGVLVWDRGAASGEHGSQPSDSVNRLCCSVSLFANGSGKQNGGP